MATLNFRVGVTFIYFYVCGPVTQDGKVRDVGGKWAMDGNGKQQSGRKLQSAGRMIRFEPGKRKSDIDIYLVLLKCQGPVFGFA